MSAQHWRHLWLGADRLARYTFWWPIIGNRSFVLVTAAQARLSATVPDRFMGDAKPIVAGNIAAHDGFVEFTLWWYGDFPSLNLWTDITVFDPSDPSGVN
jgi:hypothetical protein